MLRFLFAHSPRSPWARFTGLGALGLFGLSLWIFAELADDAPEGDYLAHEEQILKLFREPDNLAQPIGPSWLPDATRDITALGGAAVLSLLTLIVIVFELLCGRRRTAVLIAIATLGGLGLSVAMKAGFERERPTAVPHLMVETSGSFPSGHSMLSSVVYITLGALLARTLSSRALKTFIVLTAFFVAFLIGVSRVYLGVHYPTDVVAGWTAGTAWALLCWSVATWLERSFLPSEERPRDAGSQ